MIKTNYFELIKLVYIFKWGKNVDFYGPTVRRVFSYRNNI